LSTLRLRSNDRLPSDVPQVLLLIQSVVAAGEVLCLFDDICECHVCRAIKICGLLEEGLSAPLEEALRAWGTSRLDSNDDNFVSYVLEGATENEFTERRLRRGLAGKSSYDVEGVCIGCGPTTIYTVHVALNYRVAATE